MKVVTYTTTTPERSHETLWKNSNEVIFFDGRLYYKKYLKKEVLGKELEHHWSSDHLSLITFGNVFLFFLSLGCPVANDTLQVDLDKDDTVLLEKSTSDLGKKIREDLHQKNLDILIPDIALSKNSSGKPIAVLLSLSNWK